MVSEDIKKELSSLFGDIPALCYLLFKNDKNEPFKVTAYQVEIIEEILYSRHKRILCWATTRAGKSLAVALGIILKAVLVEGERIRILAPTTDHTKIVMGYIIQHIFDHQLIVDSLLVKGDLPVERLKKELTKSKITFRNGNDIMIRSGGILQDGRTLVGFGGTTIIVDEAEGIPAEIIRTKIMRMLGDTADSQIFLISNPTNKGYMYDSMVDSHWHQILVNWQMCVEEGRLTAEFVEERRAEMSDVEFTIWYDSTYPEEGEDQLIPYGKIKAATRKSIDYLPAEKASLGVDVASMGSDFTVFTSVNIVDEVFSVYQTSRTSKTSTMATVGKVVDLIKTYGYASVQVDSTGLGTGVCDRLIELKHSINPVNFGSNPEEEEAKKYHLNKKADMYFNLRRLFENGLIRIPDDKRLVDQLSKLRYEFTSAGKVKIIDPDGHSPDEADSLALACYLPKKREFYLGNLDLGRFG